MYRRGYLIDEVFGLAFGGCFGLLVLLFVLVTFLSAVARAAGRVTPENRRIEPGQVWLNLLPLFNLVWLPITVDRVAESLKNEFYTRGLDEPGSSYTRTAGLAWLVLLVFGVAVLVVFDKGGVPPLGVMAVIASLVCWVVYWVQLKGYARRLKSSPYVPPADEGW
jgi:hypothetical protein